MIIPSNLSPKPPKEKIFDAVISLGFRCIVAGQLQWSLLRTAALPFDWLITRRTSKVRELIENRFADFPDHDNLRELAPTEQGRGNFVDRKYEVQLVHDFIPNGLESQYDHVCAKFRQKSRDFLQLLDSGRKCLFIRLLDSNDPLQDAVALGEYLKKFNPGNCLYIVTAEQSQTLVMERISEGIFRVAMSQQSGHPVKSRSNRNWQGNYAHWNQLLSGVYIPPTAKMKKALEENMARTIDMAASAGREVVFWGCGEMAQHLLPYFLRQGIMPKFYDRNDAIALNEPYERIPKDKFLASPRDFFVVVTPQNDRGAIMAELAAASFRENETCCAPSYIYRDCFTLV